jgi:hypothetical protein
MVKGSNFVMIDKCINIRFKKKRKQPATYDDVQGELIIIFRTGWLFLEIKGLYKNLTLVIKVLRFISSPFFSSLSFRQMYEKMNDDVF